MIKSWEARECGREIVASSVAWRQGRIGTTFPRVFSLTARLKCMHDVLTFASPDLPALKSFPAMVSPRNSQRSGQEDAVAHNHKPRSVSLSEPALIY
jgi:hypothetical protein